MSLKLFFARAASRISDAYNSQVFWRKIDRALALHQRGEVRSDGLQLTSARTTLNIEWLARDIHPWDRDMSAEKAEQLFAEQCLNDTNAAIARLFTELPVLDAIELRVKRSPGQPPLLSGVVHRSSLRQTGDCSIGMRLRSLGLTFRMNKLCFDTPDGPLRSGHTG
jgi:hypothetical protein